MRFNVTLDCKDPEELAKFWTAAFGFELIGYAEPYAMLRPLDGKGPRIMLQKVPESKSVKNRMHLDFQVPTENYEAEVERIKSLGATQLSKELQEQYGVRWLVMKDPEGNEFCLGQRD